MKKKECVCVYVLSQGFLFKRTENGQFILFYFF